MPQTPEAPSKDGRLSFSENVGFGLGDMASNFFFQTFGIFLLYYYTDVFGIAPAAASTMFFVTRLVDAFTDPAMGAIADRTNTRWGKYRPYLLWMALPYGICGYLIFANPDFDDAGKLVYAYITYSLMMLAYTAINVPYCSLMGVLSPSSNARRVASNFRFVGAFGGGFLISLFVRPLVEKLGAGNEIQGFQYTMALFAVLSVALFLVTFATTRERVQPPPGQKHNLGEELSELIQNKPWVILFYGAVCSTTFYVMRDSVTFHYFKYVVGISDEKVFWVFDQASLFLASGKLCNVAGILCVGFFLRNFDKKPLAVMMCVGTALSIFSFYFIPADSFALMVVVNAAGTFMFGPTAAIIWSMYGDVAAYGEYKFGRRSTGLIHSASLFSLKTGSMIAGSLAGGLMAYFGFVANETQTERSIFGITLMFSVIPAIFALGKALAIWVYPLDAKKMAEIETALAERRTATE
ncbi:MFS transporter [Synoicihabitans lomoniglobus]|uniref:MFS transporter n=1 Tax=Synoicihabitans lomoniglobus TaxID=2909285 RepID=A0AAF0CPQ1_9BACT|nr:MFS transporter [Opitutaceae bacterium LMO-M01]WED65778.1 MFS transporter [Opitutaceae bacterium LMO-M01]